MSVSELTTSTQNYLKAIWALQEWDDKPVASSSLASYLGVRPSTVSDAIKKLNSQGFVSHSRYGTITLTEEGRSHAVAMIRRHRLLETYLVEELGYSWDEVHDEAEHLEHAVSDLLIERISEKLDHPSRDPHGDPIPQADGSIVIPQAKLLLSARNEDNVRIERISDVDNRLLQYLAENGFSVDTVARVSAESPFSESLTLTNETGGKVLLGSLAQQSIWVSPVKTK